MRTARFTSRHVSTEGRESPSPFTETPFTETPLPWTETPWIETSIDRDPLTPVDRMIDMCKTLPCPKLRLGAVKISVNFVGR